MEGKKEEVLASRPVQPQAHFAEIDEGVEPGEDDKPDDENVLTNEFAVMSFSHSKNINFSSYALSSVATALEDIPFTLASLSQTFNSALNSACTNHIIHNHNLFHCYDFDGGVFVNTAVCRFLETLAVEDVKFCMTINGHMIWIIAVFTHDIVISAH